MPVSIVMNTYLHFKAWIALKLGQINEHSVQQHKVTRTKKKKVEEAVHA